MKKNKLRILQVIDTLNIGGGEVVFSDLCTILFESKMDVTAMFLLNAGHLKDKLPKGMPTFELKRENKWSIAKMRQCSNILKEFDIIHCHFRHVYRYLQLVNVIFHLKRKIIFHDHYGSIDIDKKAPKFFTTILKPKYYIGVSTSLTSWAINILKIKKQNVFLLENIIIKKNNYQPYQKGKFDLILVSNIKPIKNNFFAVELMDFLDKRLLLVGENHNNEYFQKIINKSNYNLKFSIDTEISSVQEILPNFKLGLHTSKSESGPLVLIEYICQGLPFLAYQTGEVALTLKKYFPQYFIDNFDMKSWISKIEFLLTEEPDLEKMKYVFDKYYGRNQYLEKVKTIYQCIRNY